jgi:HK97 family phage portal protein
MKLFQRLKTALNQASWDDMIRAFASGADIPSGDNDISESSAMKYTAVFACCRVLAETFSSVPVFEYKKNPVTGDRTKTDDTGIYDLLHNTPNSEMSAYGFAEQAMYQLNTTGNSVSAISRNAYGQILEIYPYDYKNVTVVRDPDTQKLQYKIKNASLGSETIKDKSQVFHVAGPSLNGILGMSPIQYAMQAIRLGLTYEKFGVKFYKNGAMPSGVFEHPGFLKDEAYKRLKEDLDKNYQGLTNAGRPILAEDGLKFSPLQINPVDAQLLESKKFQVEDVCRIYRVPLHLVQNLDKATNNNIEHQSLEFVMYTMLPWFKRFESCINNQLLNKEQRKNGYYFEYNLSGLLRGDQKSMAEAFAIGRQWGWLSVNDIRRLMNMNTIPNGDIYLQPMNMVEAGAQVDPQIKAAVSALIETSKGV